MKKSLLLLIILISFFVINTSDSFAEIKPNRYDIDLGNILEDIPATRDFTEVIDLTDYEIQKILANEELYFKLSFKYSSTSPLYAGESKIQALDENGVKLQGWSLNPRVNLTYTIPASNYSDEQSNIPGWMKVPPNTKKIIIQLGSSHGQFSSIEFDIRDNVKPILQDISITGWNSYTIQQHFPNRDFDYVSPQTPLKISVEFDETVHTSDAKVKLNIVDKDGLPVYAYLNGFNYGKSLTFTYTPKGGDRLVDGSYNSIKYGDDRIWVVEFNNQVSDWYGNNHWDGRMYDSDLPLTDPTKSTLYKGIKQAGSWVLRPFKLDLNSPTAEIEYSIPDIDAESTYNKRYENIYIRNTDTGSPTIVYKYQWYNDNNQKVSEGNIVAASNGTEVINAPAGNSKYKLKLWVYDMAWNVAYAEAIFNQKDLDPPQIEFDYTSTSRNEYKSNHILNAKVKDEKIGLPDDRYIFYKWANTANIEDVSIDDCNQVVVSPITNEVLNPLGEGDETGIETPEGITGTYYLHIIALDAYGNKAHQVSDGFALDNSGPDISFEGDITISNEPIPVKITVTDTLFGEIDDESLFYQVVQEGNEPNIYDWYPFENGQMINVYKDITGNYDLCIKAMDGLGNPTNYRKYSLHFDYDPPSVNFSYNLLLPWIFLNDLETYVNIFEWPNFNNIGIDHGSFYYQWSKNIEPNEALWKLHPGTGERRTIYLDPEMEGEYHLYVKISDLFGNTASYGDGLAWKIDNKAPEISIYPNGGDGIYKKDISTNVHITDRDYMYMYYGWSLSNEVQPDWQPFGNWTKNYQGNLTMNDSYESNIWYLWIKARDTEGNERIFTSEPFYLDNTPPTGSIDFSNNYTNKLLNELQLTVDDKVSTMMSFSNDNINWSSWESFKPLKEWEIGSLEEGIHTVYVQFMDELENISEIYESQITVDTTIPTGTITYSEVEITSNNVIATVLPSDDSPVTILNNNGSKEYIFKKNGSFEFVLMDSAGNIGRVEAGVTNIDKNPPRANLTYSHSLTEWINEPIEVTIDLIDEQPDVYITSEGGNTHTFYDPGEFTFEFEDSLGNKDTVIASVYNIDTTHPKGTIIYSTTEVSASPVTTYLITDEAVTITNNEGHNRKVFYDNDEFTFTFKDKAGNTGEATAKVDNISLELPYFDLTYSFDGWTRDDMTVIYSVYHDDNIEITKPISTKEYIHTFKENGKFDVTALYTEGPYTGIEGTVVGAVYNIDRVSPTAYVNYSTTKWTNDTPVIATLLPIDDKSGSIKILNNGGSPVYNFYENGEFNFIFEDEAGNIANKTVIVNNIISEAPIPRIEYSTNEPTSEPVVASIYFDNEYPVEIINNNGDNTFTFVDNGEFTFRYSYGDGFEGSINAVVNNITSTVHEAEINYYFEDSDVPLNESELIFPTNKNILARISLIDSDFPIKVINNAGKDSYKFEENGYFEFQYEDESGQRGRIAAVVNNIDKISPRATVSYSNKNPTFSYVLVEIAISKPVDIIEKNVVNGHYYIEDRDASGKVIGIRYSMSNNGLCSFKVQDVAGNIIDIIAEVTNIDRESPIGTVAYSTINPTNQSVIATLTANEPIIVTNNNGSQYYTFEDNGSFTFRFKDLAGNTSAVEAIVNNIDKESPIVTIDYSTYVLTNQPVEVTVSANEDINVKNNNGKTNRLFLQNGYYTFEVEDLAGNKVTAKAEVNNIDITPPQILLNGDANLVITQNDKYEELGAIATDNIDGDLTNQIIINNEVINSEAGNYIVSYTVKDFAGNSTTTYRNVKVISLDELALFINGSLVDGGVVSSSTSRIALNYFGSEGNVVVKWAQGIRNEGYFKIEGNNITDNLWIDATMTGWYTIHLQDQERNTKLIYVYYTGMDR